MKKTLLYSLLCFSLSGFTQDWAPFKFTDTTKHYESKFLGQGVLASQIQMIAVDSAYTEGGSQIKIFKKGFSLNGFVGFQGQLLKGQILGDTLRIFNDSTIASTIDQFGYRLYFPHRYIVGDTFKIAQSMSDYLLAYPDSIYIDNVNGGVDSIVRIQIRAYDRLHVPLLNHRLNSSYISISKQNGFFQMQDFTNLYSANFEMEQFFFNQNFFTERENFSLTIGDEWHYTVTNGWIPTNQFNHINRVIIDTLDGLVRRLEIEHGSKLMSGSAQNSGLSIDTLLYSFIDTDIAFNLNSLIVEDSLFRGSSSFYEISHFSECSTCGFNNIFHSERLYNIVPSSFSPGFDTITEQSYGLIENYSDNLIGVDSNSYFYHNGNYSQKSIVYVKKGNQTWGTPLNLSVGLKEVSQMGSLKLYPNPVLNQLRMETEEVIKAVLVSDLNGKAVEVSRTNNLVDVSNLSSGLYFVQVETKAGFWREKFVKE